MILVDCNSKEYINEIGYISPTDILDIIPISYGMENIKTYHSLNEALLSIELRNIIQTKLSDYFYNHIHPYKELNDLDKTIVFYISSDGKENEIKDVVFCIICNLEYDKNQLLVLMKRYSKLRAFV